MPERKSKNDSPKELELSLEKLSLENNSTENSAPKKRAPRRLPTNKDAGEKSSLEKPSPANSADQISAPKKRAYKKRAYKKRACEKSPAWSMWPNLDDQIREKLEEANLNYTFNPNDEDDSAIKLYDTNIIGSFICENKNCKKQSWDSKVIPITIRLYPGKRYNARVYHQRCIMCNKLGKLEPDEQCYIDRVSYRIKRWNNIWMEAPPYGGASKGPHEEDLCEGCKHGHCIWGANGGRSPFD